MSKLMLVNLDLNGNQLLNFVVQVLASDPGSPIEGQMWYNTTTDLLKYRDGTGTRTIAAGTGVNTLGVTSPVKNTGTAQDPVIALNSGGDSNKILDTHIDAAAAIAFAKLASPVGTFSFGGQVLSNLATPSAGTDAANKSYVDAAAAGIDWKGSVRVATTANSALATTFENGDTIDGVVLATGNRILIKNQTTGSENGIYTVNASGAPTRAIDADVNAEVTSGLAVFVTEGTVNGNTAWILTTDDPIVVNTTALVFTQFAGPGEYTAGTGITLTGTVFSLTIPVAIASGGTNATTAAAARTNLGATTKFAASVGDGVALAYVVTHNLGTRDVVTQVHDNSSPRAEVLVDVEHTSTNTITLRFAVAPTSNQYRVTVIG